MKPIPALVRAKLEAQAGEEAAAALWERLWAAYEKGGVDEAEGLLAALHDDGGGAK